MVAIKDVAVYVPPLRIDGKEIREQTKVARHPVEKAVASYDEDPVTLAYEAGTMIDELEGKPEGKFALIFVSSSWENLEKNPANTLVQALDLPESTKAIFISGGQSSIISAIYLGNILVKSGEVEKALILTGEKRRGASWQTDFCLSDAGGAMLIGEGNGVFKINRFYNIQVETWDATYTKKSVEVFDERYTSAEQFVPLLKEIKKNLEGERVVLSAPSYGILEGILRFVKQKDDIISTLGCLGSSQIPASLTYLTGEIKKGQKLIAVGFGPGAWAVELEFTGERTPHEKMLKILERKRYISFGDYMKIKDIDGLPEDETSIPMLWRERKQNLRFYGQKCEDCNSSMFPIQNYCHVCGGKKLHEEKLPKEGEVFTFTEDYLTQYSEIFPPLPMIVVKLKNGARVYVQGIFGEEKFHIGQQVELTLRIINKWNGLSSYFYKARPKT